MQQPIFLNHGTSVGPALAAFQNKLYIAWKGIENDPTIYWSSFDGQTWAPQQKVPASIEGTSDSPALAAFQNKLYMAWKGAGNSLLLYWSSFDGHTWAPQRSEIAGGTNNAPSLTTFKNGLYMLWKGVGKGVEGDPRLFWSMFDGKAWTPQRDGALGGMSDRPTLTVL